MTHSTLGFGKRCEQVAADFLRSKGYRIVQRNYRTPRGELDLIALDGEMLVFVEVKARSGLGFGGPHGAVDRKKRQHMIQASLFYISREKLHDRSCRFDVVLIQQSGDRPAKIDHIQNAVEVDDFGYR